MAKFNENELTEKLKEYKNKGNIMLELERGLDGKIELEDATVIYDEKTGFIKISGKNCELEINTTMVCKYEENGNEIKIERLSGEELPKPGSSVYIYWEEKDAVLIHNQDQLIFQAVDSIPLG